MAEESHTTSHPVQEWVEEYSDKLYSWALHKTSSQGVAQDLVQDTFLSAYKNYDGFKQKSKPETWLFSILNNKIIDYYRKHGNRIVRLESGHSTSFDHPESLGFDDDGNWEANGLEAYWEDESNLLDDPEFLKIFDQCINELPDKWRNAVSMTYYSEVGSKYICQELGITPSNYWQILRRSKLALKKCIEQHWV